MCFWNDGTLASVSVSIALFGSPRKHKKRAAKWSKVEKRRFYSTATDTDKTQIDTVIDVDGRHVVSQDNMVSLALTTDKTTLFILS